MDTELIPKLRFEGFTEPWEEKKLGDIGNLVRGKRFTPDDYVPIGDAGIPCIHYGEIYTDYGSTATDTISQIRSELSQKLRYAKPGSIIISTTSENAEDVCKAVAWLGNAKVAYHDDSVALEHNENPMFLVEVFSTDNFYRKKTSAAQGIKVLRISPEQLANIEVTLPNSFEQSHIGQSFCEIDSLIAQQEKKCAALGAARDALLDKMFPKEGETEPELRFDGFSGPWERVKLGELLSYEQPQAYIVSNSEYNDSHGIPVLTAGKTFILGYTDECFGVKQATKMKPVILFDDFTTACKYVDFPFKVKSSAAKILIPTTKCDCTYFVYESMNMINYEPLSHGRHWISMFSSFSINLPVSPFERQMLNFMLINIDENINGENQKLDLLKQLKGAMLDKMFPKGAR